MKRWEYLVERTPKRPGEALLTQRLDEYGARGWELHKVLRVGTARELYFKRALPDGDG